MTGAITNFLCAKAVISANENSKNGLKILRLSGKAPAAPCRGRDIMPQVSVDTFHCEGVTFVMDIENVLSWEDHVQIASIPIRAVLLSLLGCIHHLLDCSGRFVRTHHMTYNLSWIPAHHRHDIDIFPRFRAGLAFQKPVQFIQFYRLWRAESSALSTSFFAFSFYPICHIGFVHSQYFPTPAAADTAVVYFDCQLPGLFRIRVPLPGYGVIYAALLAFAAPRPRTVVPCPDPILCLSAFRTFFPCLFCSLSHTPYSTIISLFWTIPGK